MMLALLVLVFVGALLVRRRSARRNALAGLNSERPTFAVTPPRRRLVDRREGRL